MLNMLETEEGYDFICPECKNYVLLEKNKDNKNILEGKCALCGLEISMLYEKWKKMNREKQIKTIEYITGKRNMNELGFGAMIDMLAGGTSFKKEVNDV